MRSLGLAALSGLVLTLACGVGGYSPPEPPSPREATQVNASMGRTWDAVIDLFATRTISIRTIERVSGIIVTERLSVGHEDGLAWADCGKMGGLSGQVHISPNYATYNVLVRGDSLHSSVKTTVRWVHINPREVDLEGGGVTECSTKHVWERALETDIKARAEEPKLAQRPEATIEPSKTAETVLQLQELTGSSSTRASADDTRGYVPQSTAANRPESSGARPTAELLREPDFTSAVRDLQALRVLVGFQELGRDLLRVEVSDQALTTDLSEYNFGRFFSAYYRTTGWSPRTTILFSHGDQILGSYTRDGFVARK